MTDACAEAREKKEKTLSPPHTLNNRQHKQDMEDVARAF